MNNASNPLSSSVLRLIFSILVLFSAQSVSGQNTIPTVGTEFWLGYMNNSGSSNEELRLFITSQTASVGTVDVPLQGWSTTFTVQPNITTTVIIPNSVAEHFSNDAVDLKGVHVTTSDTVSLFAINFATYSADASKILPKVSLGTKYLVSAYGGLSSANKSEFLIVATEDGTQISITPSVTTLGWHPAGVPYIIDLDEGETYQVQSSSISGDLTGTWIEATPASGECRPFAVFAGAQCTNIPSGCSTCDHLYDQLFPTETWGSEYYVPPFLVTGVYTYRVLARDNGTQISINGAAPVAMNSGQMLEFNNISGAVQVVSNNPVQVIQYMQGDACSLDGDPTMLVLNANDQKIKEVTFSTVASLIITTHFLNLVVETADIGTVLLDNVPIPAGNFTLFPTNPMNSYAQVSVTQGSHNIYAANGFTAYSYGMGSAESYAYSVGSFKSEQILQIDSLICSTDTVVLSPPHPIFTPEWSTISDPTTIIGTNNIMTLYPPLVTDIYVINGFSFISGCPESFNFSVAVPTVPIIETTADEDTVCMFQSVQMDVTISSPGTFEYSWFPAYQFNNPSSPSPVLTVQQSGWYGVHVSTIGGICTLASDSVYIYVAGGGIESLTVTSNAYQLCAPDVAQLSSEIEQVVFSEDFDGGSNPGLWTTIVGGAPSSICGSNSGDGLYFSGAPTRFAETVNLDVSQGGTVNFYIKVASGVTPCDDANFGEDVQFEYSINGGLSWVTIATLFEFNYPIFTFVSLPIPPGALTTATRFRWIQPLFSAPDEDVWILDNVSISVTNNANINYNWSPASSLSDPSIFNPVASPDTATWYVLEVGQGLCVYSDSVFIDVNPEFTLATTPDVTMCSDQEQTLVTTASTGTGYTYFWSPPATITSTALNDTITVLPLVVTTYYVTVTSPLGCAMSDSVTVGLVVLDVEVLGDSTLCEGDLSLLNAQVTNTAVVGYTYEWFDPNSQVIGTASTVQVTPSTSSTYSVLISDPNSACTWTDSLDIIVDAFNVDAGEDTVLCSVIGYQLQGFTDAVGGTVSWNNGVYLNNTSILNPVMVSNNSADFILSVDNGNCTDSDTVTVTYNAPLSIYIPDDTTLCLGEDFTIDFQTATSIVWSTTVGMTNANSNTPTFSPTQDVTYIVTYSSSNNCSTTDTMNIQVLELPTVTLPNDITICDDVPLLVEAFCNVGNADYLWSTGQADSSIWIQSAGTYEVEVSTVCGTDMADIVITVFPQFTIDLGNDTTICEAYTQVLSPAIPVGGNAVWSTSSTANSITVSSPSVTSVIVSDINGCVEMDTIEINAFPGIVVDLGVDYSICEDAQTTLDAISPQGVSYLWSTGETTPSIVIEDAGMFIVQITDAGGCMKWDSIAITETPLPSPQIVGPVDFCENEVVTFSVSQSYAGYLWFSGVTTPTADQYGLINEITVQVTDNMGCVGSDTLLVNVVDVPVLDLGTDIVLCETGLTILDGNVPGAIGYLWNTGETSSSIDAVPGIYILDVSYDICTITDTIVIVVTPMEFELGEDLVLCNDETIFIAHSLIGIDSIIWHDGSNSSWYEHGYVSSLEDSVLVIGTAYGCRVEVDSIWFILEDCNCKVYVPNAITLNSDGMNDEFRVYHDCPIEDFYFRIFNRWGEMIFESYDTGFVWDGRNKNGEYVQDGVYTWSMKYLNEYTLVTTSDELAGHITVLR